MTSQPDVRSWRRAEEAEHCSAGQCSFLSQEVLQQQLLWFPQAASGTLMFAES